MRTLTDEQGAVNVRITEQLREYFWGTFQHPSPGDVQRHLVVFYCEFSSQRAPEMYGGGPCCLHAH